MTAGAQPRQVLLGTALAATLAATAWVATRPEESNVIAAMPAHRAPARPAMAASAMPTPPAPSREPWAEVEPAQLTAWQPPAPPPPPPPPPAAPPAAAAPPPAPVAPPAPYQMIGRIVEADDGKAVEVALLSGPNKALSARAGDVLDGQWRVEQVSTSGVRLTWLPSKLPQNIVFKPVP